MKTGLLKRVCDPTGYCTDLTYDAAGRLSKAEPQVPAAADAGAVISFAYQFSTPAPAELDTTMNKVMPIVILAIIAALWLYAKRSGEKGWLK